MWHRGVLWQKSVLHLKTAQKTLIWPRSSERVSSSMVSRKMKVRKRAEEEKKCHMSWLSKKSITLHTSFRFRDSADVRFLL